LPWLVGSLRTFFLEIGSIIISFLAIPQTCLYSEPELSSQGFGPRPVAQAFEPVQTVILAYMFGKAAFFQEPRPSLTLTLSPQRGERVRVREEGILLPYQLYGGKIFL
jgi:hypothetical protein